jgi:hypothetical protein
MRNVVTHITCVQMHAATEPVLFEYKYVFQREEEHFIISDKLAGGHEATPETQLPRDVVVWHRLHRTSTKGTVPPAN